MRECGACTACCTRLAVAEIGKVENERCKHLTDQGCGIYETRPDECRRYFCLWADPKAESLDLPDWGRPDRTGVVLNSSSHEAGLKRDPINVFRLEGGSEYWAQKLLKRRKLQMFPLRLMR